MKSMKVRRILLSIVSITILVIGLSGCSGAETNNTSGTNNAQGSNLQGRIDPEQPERVAEIYGKVKSIQGNVVIIAEMQRTQTGAEMTDEERAQRRAQMQSLSDEERRAFQASQEVMTGKTITITVPVGIPVKVKASGTDGGTVEDGTIASIIAGSTLNIWTDKDDPSTAEYVSISNR